MSLSTTYYNFAIIDVKLDPQNIEDLILDTVNTLYDQIHDKSFEPQEDEFKCNIGEKGSFNNWQDAKDYCLENNLSSFIFYTSAKVYV